MTSDDRIQSAAVLRHYVRCFAAMARGPIRSFALTFVLVGAVFLGRGVAAFGGLWDKDDNFTPFLLRAPVWLMVMICAGTALFTAFFAFFPKSQRCELAAVLAWPLRWAPLGLMKFLDGVLFPVLFLLFLLPLMLTDYVECPGPDAALFAASSHFFFCGLGLALWLGAQVAVAAAFPVYRALPDGAVRFRMWTAFWGTLTVYPFVCWAARAPWACAMASMLGKWLAVTRDACIGGNAWTRLAFIALAISGAVGGFRCAITLIGRFYHANVQDSRKQGHGPACGAARRGSILSNPQLPFVSRETWAVWSKDVKSFCARAAFGLTLLALAPAVLFIALAPEEHAGRLLRAWRTAPIVFAMLGVSCMEFVAVVSFGVEGRGVGALAGYPVQARRIFLGKTLAIVTVHAPLVLLYAGALLVPGRGGPDEWAAFAFWFAWLFPLSAAMISVGAVLEISVIAAAEDVLRVLLLFLLYAAITAVFMLLYLGVFLVCKATHWGFFLIGIAGSVMVYQSVASWAVSHIPGLRVWGVDVGAHAGATLKERIALRVQKCGLWFPPFYLAFLAIANRSRPFRYWPVVWQVVLLALPIALAAVLFTRKARNRIKVPAGLVLLTLVAWVSVGWFGMPFGRIQQSAWRATVANYAKVREILEGDAKGWPLPVDIADEFGLPAGADLHFVWRYEAYLSAPRGERMLEFVRRLRVAGVPAELWRRLDGERWFWWGLVDCDRDTLLRFWRRETNATSCPEYLAFLRSMIFRWREDWTQEALYRYLRTMLESPESDTWRQEGQAARQGKRI